MSKIDTMAKPPALFQRTGVWNLRVMIPRDFQSAYQGRTKVLKSLDTADRNEATYFSQWFSSSRAPADGTTLPDFDSMPHAVRSKLASAGIAEPLIDTLIGHEVKGSSTRCEPLKAFNAPSRS